MTMRGFETKAVRMEPMLLLTLLAPPEDVDRLMAAVVKIAPLVMGKYDCNAYQSGGGVEWYRPLEGAAAGPEAEVRKRPGTVALCFELPPEPQLVEQVVEAIFQTHSYQEPVIRIQNILGSRSRGLDDRDNPNRWWNTTGDWKKSASSGAEPGSR
jgi:hypothetical protein